MLLQVWHARIAATEKNAILTSCIKTLLGGYSEEIEFAVSKLRRTSRDDAIALQAIVRSIVGRDEFEDYDGTSKQVQLLMLPLILQADEEAANGNAAQTSSIGPNTQKAFAIPEELELEGILCEALQLESGSLRAAPFFIDLLSVEHMIFSDIAELGTDIVYEGKSASLEPALFDGCEEQRGRRSLLLPMTWLAESSAPFPKSLAEQCFTAECVSAIRRIETSLKNAWFPRGTGTFKIYASKPIPFAMSQRCMRLLGLILDLRALNEGGAVARSGTQLWWRLRGDWLFLTFSRAGQNWKLEVLLPDENERDVRELVDQIAACLGLCEVHEQTSA